MSSRLRPELAGALYTATQEWVDRALRRDDSLFTPGRSIWSAAELANFYQVFAEQAYSGTGSFLEKLGNQLSGASPDIVQLAAELYYVHLLMIADTGGPAKRRQVELILSWSSRPVAVPPKLDQAFDNGMASLGVAHALVFQQVRFLTDFARAWKELGPERREAALQDPWTFRQFVFGLPPNSAFAQREALLHLVHPDTFEPIVSREMKRQIADCFSGYGARVTDEGLDRELIAIRQRLTNQFGPDFTFWDTPVASLWQGPWGSFIGWARRFYEWDGFDKEERDYKLRIAEQFARARNVVLANEPDWLNELRKAFSMSGYNLTDFRVHGKFLAWCSANEASAHALLKVLWDTPAPSAASFLNVLPTEAVSGPGGRASIASVLLLGVDATDSPVFRSTPYAKGCELTGFPPLPADPSGTEVYKHGHAFVERMESEAALRGLNLRDHLDAQSLLFCVTQWPLDLEPVSKWTESDRHTFTRYRGDGAERVVKIAPGEGAKYWDECREGGYICVGWDAVGDLRRFESKHEFAQAFKDAYLAEYNGSASATSRKATELWTLRGLKPGNVVIANRGKSYVLAVGEVIEPGYDWRADRPEFRHIVHVSWDTSYAGAIPEQGVWGTTTVAPVSKDLYKLILEGYKPPIGNEGTPAARHVRFDDVIKALDGRGLYFPGEVVAAYLLALQTKRFVILTGISGTGKTQLAMAVGEAFRGDRTALPRDPGSPDGNGLDLRVHPYMLKYHRLVVPEALASVLRAGRALVSAQAGTEDIEVVYPSGTTRLSLYRYPGRNVLVLGFRGAFRSWFDNSLQLGDHFYLDAEGGDEDGAADRLRITIPSAGASQVREKSDRVRVVAVRPDWTDGRGLLGYFNPLTERYAMTPFLQLLLDADEECTGAARAGTEPEPFFAILDEMNLARVEHYFSDFLSALESGQALELHQSVSIEAGETENDIAVPRRLKVPPNVFFTGTVNIDETTYMFSPKVLDRAFVLELNKVDLAGYGLSGEAPHDSGLLRLDGLEGALRFERNPDSTDWQAFRALPGADLAGVVVALHTLLAIDQRHFGYRVANEVARFVSLAADQADASSETLWSALDLAVLEKVLPKLNGTQQELEGVLRALFTFFVSGGDDQLAAVADTDPNHWELSGDRIKPTPDAEPTELGGLPRLPRCSAKIKRMLDRLQQQGFTSFIE